MRVTSRSVYKRFGCRNHPFALALVNAGPGHPVPQARPGDPQVLRDLGERLLPQRVQPAPPPAGASPCSMVPPEMVRPPPAARVISTRRAWAFDDAGIITCRTPSA